MPADERRSRRQSRGAQARLITRGAVQRVVDELEGAIVFERALLIGVAGWIARSPVLADKLFLCRWVWAAAERVRTLDRALPSTRRGYAIEAGSDADTRHLVDTMLAAPSARAFVQGLVDAVFPAAAAVYSGMADLHGAAARPAQACARDYRRAAKRRYARHRPSMDREERAYCSRVRDLTDALVRWRAGDCGPLTTSEVLKPARECSIRAQGCGEVCPEEWLGSGERQHHQYLHQMIAFEVGAFETVGRQIADFPWMPWAFQRDMAMQIRDECRHLLMWLERLRRRGGRLGDFRLCTVEFDLCAGQPLAGRLALLQRIVEGFALEALDLNRLLWESRGDLVMVDYIERVQLDEVMHVRKGNEWLRWLCGDEQEISSAATRALAQARARLVESAQVLAARGCVEVGNLDRLLGKLAQGRGMPVNVELRRRAGFSDEAIRDEGRRRDAQVSV